jgi:hypothetical protein
MTIARIVIATALLLSVPALRAQTAPTGTVETGSINGAPFYIEIPANWNKGLVMYAHGCTLPGSKPPDPNSQRMKPILLRANTSASTRRPPDIRSIRS